MTLTEAFAVRRRANALASVDPKVLEEAKQVIATRVPVVAKQIADEVRAKLGIRS